MKEYTTARLEKEVFWLIKELAAKEQIKSISDMCRLLVETYKKGNQQ